MIGNVNEKVRKYILKPDLEVKKYFFLILLPKVLKTVFLKQKSLCDIFKKFKVDVYLSNTVVKNNLNFEVYEPAQAGKNGKKVLAFIKGEPEQIFNSGSLIVYSFNFKKNNSCISY